MVELCIKLSYLRPEGEAKFKIPARNGMLHGHLYTGESEPSRHKDGIISSGCCGFMPAHYIFFKDQDIVLSQEKPGDPIMVAELFCQTMHPIHVRFSEVIFVSHGNKDFYNSVVKHMESLHEKP